MMNSQSITDYKKSMMQKDIDITENEYLDTLIDKPTEENNTSQTAMNTNIEDN